MKPFTALRAGLSALAFAVAGLVALPGAAHAAGTAWYIDCSAAANGNGSSTSPYNSLAALDAHTFGPGDQIYFKRGATCAGQFAPTGSGTAGSPITVAAYGSGTARPVIAGGGVSAAVYLYNVQQWEINDLEVTDTGASTGVYNGIQVELHDFGTGSHYVIDNVYVHDVNGGDTKASNGIGFTVTGTTTPTKFDDVTVENSEIYNVDREGLTTGSTWSCRAIYGTCASGTAAWVPSTRVVFTGNTVHDIGGDGVVVRAATGAVVEHNTVYDIWMRSAQNNAGVWTIDSDDTVIQYNEVYQVHKPTLTDGMAFDSDFGNRGTVIQYNYSHDNQGGFLLFCGTCNTGSSTSGTVVRYNLSVNDGSRLMLGAGEQGAQIYNNTFYLPSGSTTLVVEDDHGTTDAAWSNNVIDNQGTGGYGGSDYVPGNYSWRDNAFYGNHPANEPTDAGKITANPLLTSPGSTSATGYQLQTGSPARAAGQVTTDSGRLDYFGSPAPTVCRPDIGFQQASAFNDSSCAGTNAVANPGFETGTLAPWTTTTGVLTTSNPHAGSYSAQAGPSPVSFEQTVTVKPNTTYVLSGWGRVNADDTQIVVGIKNYGGAETRAPAFVTSDWRGGSATITTGATNTTAIVYCYVRTGTGTGWCDDVSLTPQP